MSESPFAGRKVQWELMLKHELDAAVAAFPVAYLPFGICEPHGLYNPLGLDGLKAHALCVRAAREGGGVAAPACFWHTHEESEVSRRFLSKITASPLYLTSMPFELVLRQYLYQLRACVNAGFRAVIAVTGHYGGGEFFFKVCSKLFQRHVRPIPVWAMADWEVIDYQDELGRYKGSHAGLCETAQLLALHPDLPDLSAPGLQDPDPYVGGKLEGLRESVTPERGEAIVASQTRNLIAGARRMLERAPDAALPFIEMDEMKESVQALVEDRAGLPCGVFDPRPPDFRERFIRPMAEGLRATNGALPRSAFPEEKGEWETGEWGRASG